MIRKEVFAVYSAGLMQGIALVAFPAVSTVFTNPSLFNFSSSMYGALFIPQSVISIIASFASSALTSSLGAKKVFLSGLLANFVSMALLALSAVFMHDMNAAYPILMAATGFLGLGFGLTVPTVNIMAALFNPSKVDAMILILNALLGVGTALSPVFVAIFIGLGFWWGLPLMLALALLFICLFSLPLALPDKGRISSSDPSPKKSSTSPKFLLFAAFALFYGTIETLNGNWIVIYMKQQEGAAVSIQSLALTAFWAMVTIGRVFFALIEKFFHEVKTFQMLPFIAAAAFIIIFSIPKNHPHLAIMAFALSGFACSALLPLVISFGQTQLKSMAAFVTGGVVASYLAGYGIAAFGAGGLHDMTGLSLKDIYGLGAIISLALAMLAIKIASNQKKIL